MQKVELEGATIIFIEYDQSMAGLVAMRLTAAGADVRWYPDIQSGLSNLAKQKPDMILVDAVTARSVDTRAIREQVQNNHILHEVPIVIISDTHSQVAMWENNNVTIHTIEKSASFDDMLITIERVVTNPDEPASPAPLEPINATKVLVVEDDPLIRNVLAQKLTPSHFTSRYVENGNDALPLAKAFMPDVVILDLMLPGIDGFGILEQLRDMDMLKHTRVLIYTNRDEDADRHRATELGVKDFFVKVHTDVNDLIGTVAAHKTTHAH